MTITWQAVQLRNSNPNEVAGKLAALEQDGWQVLFVTDDSEYTRIYARKEME